MSKLLIAGIINQKQTPYIPPPPIVATGFTTEWQTTASNETITLPLFNYGTFNATVDWGDGTPESTITSYNDADRIHEYADAGTYRVEIKGECPGWAFNNGGDRLKIKKVLNWGEASEFGGFQYLNTAFYGCTNLTSLGVGKILTKPTLTTLYRAFRGTAITTIPSGLLDNCSAITTNGGSEIFYGTSITSVPVGLLDAMTGVGSWSSLFDQCSDLETIPAGLFNNQTILGGGFFYTFRGCGSLTAIPSGLFSGQTAVTTFQSTFQFCNSLTAIPSGLFDDSPNVTSFVQTFAGCGNLTAITTGLFNNNTKVVSFQRTFDGDYQLAGSIPTGLFDSATGCTSFYETFKDCQSLTGAIPTDLFRYCPNVEPTQGFRATFQGCAGLTSIPEDIFRYQPNITHFTSTFSALHGLTSLPAGLFRYNTAAEQFNSTFNYVLGIQSIPEGLFSGCTAATSFAGTFSGCYAITGLSANLFAYNTGVTNFQTTFQQCNNLIHLPAGLFDNNTEVTSFLFTFSNCNVLQTIPNNFFDNNTKVLTFQGTFGYCRYALYNIPIGLFSANTLCTNFNGVFARCPLAIIHDKIFDANGTSGSTRFFNQSVDFTNAFEYNVTFDGPYTGTIGTAPELWGYDYGSGTPISTGAFKERNFSNYLTNYNDIPPAWY